MKLDPAKLEQCYLALYSVYTNHMGQGKKDSQVAMKCMISDLRKEAVLRDAMSPPRLVVPTITGNTIKHYAATYNLLRDTCLEQLVSFF